jgi:ferredoxin--NADP+ reductase
MLRQYASQGRRGRAKRIALRFLLSPARILGERRVEGVELVRNQLERADDGTLRARPTGARAVVSAGLVLRAVGYRGRPLAGVPFDERRGIIDNVGGRVINPDGTHSREYVVGWAKRGPSGVIGTNKRCAQDTVRVLIQDMVAGRLNAPVPVEPDTQNWLREVQSDVVTYADWETLDRHEQDLGQRANRPRAKLTRVGDMLDVLNPPEPEHRTTAALARFWA